LSNASKREGRLFFQTRTMNDARLPSACRDAGFDKCQRGRCRLRISKRNSLVRLALRFSSGTRSAILARISSRVVPFTITPFASLSYASKVTGLLKTWGWILHRERGCTRAEAAADNRDLCPEHFHASLTVPSGAGSPSPAPSWPGSRRTPPKREKRSPSVPDLQSRSATSFSRLGHRAE